MTERDFTIHVPARIAAGDVRLVVHNHGPGHARADRGANVRRSTCRSAPTGHGRRGRRSSRSRSASLEPGPPGQRPRARPASAARPLRALLQHGRPLPRRHVGDVHGGVGDAAAPGRSHPFAGSRPPHRRRDPGHVRALLGDQRRPLDPGDLALAAPRGGARGRRAPADARRALRQRGAARPRRRRRPTRRRRPASCDESAHALLDGGIAPAVNGDDDETDDLRRVRRRRARRSSSRSSGSSRDLTRDRERASRRPAGDRVPLTAHEHLRRRDPSQRLRILAALTSNVSLNAARTIAASADRSIERADHASRSPSASPGFSSSLLLALALVAATRRQTAHFRSLVTASTDLVLVFGADGCRYASDSVTAMVGRAGRRAARRRLRRASSIPTTSRPCAWPTPRAGPSQLVFRMRNQLRRVAPPRGPRHRPARRPARPRRRPERARRHRARPARGGADPPGLPRRPHRAGEPRALPRPPRPGARALGALAASARRAARRPRRLQAGERQPRPRRRRRAAPGRRRALRATPSGPSDTLARLGGDEFALLLDGADERQAIGVARRLLERALRAGRRRRPRARARREHRHRAAPRRTAAAARTCSATPTSRCTRPRRPAAAASRSSGTSMARELGELLGLEHELRLGLQRGEFHAPLPAGGRPRRRARSSASRRSLRWKSPTRGARPARPLHPGRRGDRPDPPARRVRPARGVPADGATGGGAGLLPTRLRHLGQRLGQAARRRRRQPRSSSEALEAAGLAPDRLGLEVTETAIVAEGAGGERARAELAARCTTRACGIAIDDFGTGFSSLGQLRQLPGRRDQGRPLVRPGRRARRQGRRDHGQPRQPRPRARPASRSPRASSPTSQLASMRELGCDLAQGYLFAHPAPAAEIEGLPGRRPAADRGRLSGTVRGVAAPHTRPTR